MAQQKQTQFWQKNTDSYFVIGDRFYLDIAVGGVTH